LRTTLRHPGDIMPDLHDLFAHKHQLAEVKAEAQAEKKRRDFIDWMLFLLAIITLTLNATQAYRLSENVKLSNWITIEAQTLDVDKTMIGHPEIQRYFYSGQDISVTDKNYPLAFAQAEYLADFIDNVIATGRRADKSAFDPTTWQHYYEHTFRNSPLLCRVVLGDSELYARQTVDVARSYCKQAPHVKAFYPTS
jgi:hypothetical protein